MFFLLYSDKAIYNTAVNISLILYGYDACNTVILKEEGSMPLDPSILEIIHSGNSSIEITGYTLTADDVDAIFHELDERDTVISLSLRSNRFDARAVEQVVNALRDNTTIQIFSFGQNNIGREGADAFANMLQENITLREVHLPTNNTGYIGTGREVEIGRDEREITPRALFNFSSDVPFRYDTGLSPTAIVALRRNSSIHSYLLEAGDLIDHIESHDPNDASASVSSPGVHADQKRRLFFLASELRYWMENIENIKSQIALEKKAELQDAIEECIETIVQLLIEDYMGSILDVPNEERELQQEAVLLTAILNCINSDKDFQVLISYPKFAALLSLLDDDYGSEWTNERIIERLKNLFESVCEKFVTEMMSDHSPNSPSLFTERAATSSSDMINTALKEALTKLRNLFFGEKRGEELMKDDVTSLIDIFGKFLNGETSLAVLPK